MASVMAQVCWEQKWSLVSSSSNCVEGCRRLEQDKVVNMAFAHNEFPRHGGEMGKESSLSWGNDKDIQRARYRVSYAAFWCQHS